jgi:hypothetical protein
MLSQNVILIVGPSSSGKSSIANILTNTKYNFKKINTKKLENETVEEHSKFYYFKELSKASDIAGKEIKDLKELLQISRTTEKEELKNLASDIFNSSPSNFNNFFYDILYYKYFQEVLNTLSKGYNSIIDHNIFLNEYGSKKFLDIFSPLGKNFKIVEIFIPLSKGYSNLKLRNSIFYKFVNNFHSGDDAIQAIKEYEEIAGSTVISFRRPLMWLDTWSLMYEFTSAEKIKDSSIILDKVTGSEIKEVIQSIVADQKKLIGYILLKNFPTKFPIDESALDLKSLDYLKNFKDEEEVFIINKKFKHDYILKNSTNISLGISKDTNIIDHMVNELFSDASFIKDSNFIDKEIEPTSNTSILDDLEKDIIKKYKTTLLNNESNEFNQNIYVKFINEVNTTNSIEVLNINNIKNSLISFKLAEELKRKSQIIVCLSKNDKYWEGFFIMNFDKNSVEMLYINSERKNLVDQDTALMFITDLFISLKKINSDYVTVKISEYRDKNNNKILLQKLIYNTKL